MKVSSRLKISVVGYTLSIWTGHLNLSAKVAKSCSSTLIPALSISYFSEYLHEFLESQCPEFAAFNSKSEYLQEVLESQCPEFAAFNSKNGCTTRPDSVLLPLT